MDGAGLKRIVSVAVLVAGLAIGGDALARDGASGDSWAPVTSPDTAAGPAKPAAQLPREPSDADEVPRSWAPPGLGAKPGPGTESGPGGAPSAGTAQGKLCQKADFEAVVDDAAGALRDLNLENKPAFQEKLRQLKEKRGWSHDAFLKEAAPFVRDDKIAVYDQESERLLSDISSLGQEGAEAPSPDCELLADLKSRMKTLVDAQTAKWSYMFQKLDAALKQ